MEFLKREALFQHLPLLNKEILVFLIDSALLYLTHRRPFFDSGEFYEQALGLGCQVSKNEFTSACEGLTVLIEWMLKNNPENTGRFTFVNILSTHSALGEDLLTEIDEFFTRKIKEYSDKKPIFGNLHLIDVDWNAGITVATDSSNGLNTPYIKLQLNLANPQTGLCSRETISLDYLEFKNLLRETRKISSIMNTL